MTQDLIAVVDAFDLGEVTEAPQYLADGLMNRNWRISTKRGAFAVKQILDVPLDAARRNLGTLSGLAANDIPVCTPMISTSGDTVAEIEDRGYCVIEWVDGVHVRGRDLRLDQASGLGVRLGHIHQALAASPPAPVPAAPPTAEVTPAAQAAQKADGYLTTIAALDAQTSFDMSVAELLEQRKQLLAQHADDYPLSEVPAGPYGWTHGDFQYRNVLWRDGQVAAVLDWDRLRVRPYAEEVARTAQVQFGVDGRFDLERVQAFVAGYRTVIDLPAEALDDGVRRLWWKRLTDFWQLSFHYKRGDHGCDGLFLDDEALLHWWTARLDQVQAAMRG
ncbi:phosphotransferase [Streptomyces sp. YC504]|uniref:Phosphotransferase n=1 Tax=Streptomyces mesophilus TaxID=1775132 RepID=A0A6G4XDD8_9ACTN|nr:phosphotransferase [Streptomyces mesophilus]